MENKTDSKSIAIVIPVYQPLSSLPDLVKKLRLADWDCPEIIVVNDGSDDSKKYLFEDLAAIPGVIILHHAVNMGKGAALRTAFNYVLVKYPLIAGVITVDADGQHLPHDVVAVSREFLGQPNSLVLGYRVFSKDVPLRSRFGNILTGHIFRLLVGKRLRDTQTGLRGVPAHLMKRLMGSVSNRYEFELDMLILCARESICVAEVPISTVYEDGNKSSHFNPILDSLKIYFVFVRFISLSLLTCATDLIIFTIFFGATKDMLWSVIVGRAAGLCVSAFGSKVFVFKSDIPIVKVAVKFFALWLTLLGISYSLMVLFVNYWNINIYVSRIFVDSVLFIFNFLVQRDLIFRRSRINGNSLDLGE